jgi:hypothetical protein
LLRAKESTFLNIPYDPSFTKMYLAYIAGVSSFGLMPRATLEIPGGERRIGAARLAQSNSLRGTETHSFTLMRHPGSLKLARHQRVAAGRALYWEFMQAKRTVPRQ